MKRKKRSQAVINLQKRNQKLQIQNAKLRKLMSNYSDKKDIAELAQMIFAFKDVSAQDAFEAAEMFKKKHDEYMKEPELEEPKQEGAQ